MMKSVISLSQGGRRKLVPRTVLFLACLVLSAVAPGCGGSADESSASDEMTVEDPTSESTPDDVDCRVSADAAPVMYVGWSIWEELGLGGEDSGDAKIPDEIKADVETLAGALVERSGYYSDAYAGEDLGFPPDDLGIPPGSGAPTDNEIEDFYWARETIGREVRTLHRLEAWARANCLPSP